MRSWQRRDMAQDNERWIRLAIFTVILGLPAIGFLFALMLLAIAHVI